MLFITRYYPALKTLEQLEHVLLPRVGPYAWCSHISTDIPKLRQAIQDASMADLRDFLENIRRLSPQVCFIPILFVIFLLET